MEKFRCPICGVERPEDIHLDHCTYEGPDFGPNGEDPDDEDDA